MAEDKHDTMNNRFPLMEKDTLFLYTVPKEELEEPYILQLIDDLAKEAIEYDPVEFDLETIKERIYEEEYTLTLVVKDSKIVASGILQIEIYPNNNRALKVIFAKGIERLGKYDCNNILFCLEKIAASNNCVRLEWVGRLGWKGLFKDRNYDEVCIMRKKVI